LKIRTKEKHILSKKIKQRKITKKHKNCCMPTLTIYVEGFCARLMIFKYVFLVIFCIKNAIIITKKRSRDNKKLLQKVRFQLFI
jgi:hypothetical protein